MIPTITRFMVKPCIIEQELHAMVSFLPLLIVTCYASNAILSKYTWSKLSEYARFKWWSFLHIFPNNYMKMVCKHLESTAITLQGGKIYLALLFTLSKRVSSILNKLHFWQMGAWWSMYRDYGSSVHIYSQSGAKLSRVSFHSFSP